MDDQQLFAKVGFPAGLACLPLFRKAREHHVQARDVPSAGVTLRHRENWDFLAHLMLQVPDTVHCDWGLERASAHGSSLGYRCALVACPESCSKR